MLRWVYQWNTQMNLPMWRLDELTNVTLSFPIWHANELIRLTLIWAFQRNTQMSSLTWHWSQLTNVTPVASVALATHTQAWRHAFTAVFTTVLTHSWKKKRYKQLIGTYSHSHQTLQLLSCSTSEAVAAHMLSAELVNTLELIAAADTAVGIHLSQMKINCWKQISIWNRDWYILVIHAINLQAQERKKKKKRKEMSNFYRDCNKFVFSCKFYTRAWNDVFVYFEAKYHTRGVLPFGTARIRKKVYIYSCIYKVYL